MVAPLFVADLATLKQRLRLTGMSAGSDGEQILDTALLDVRASFNARLGTARVAELKTFGPLSADPTTSNEILFALAVSTEVRWVRLELSCTLPWLWQDSQGGAGKAWNEEAPFREKGEVDFEQLRTKAMAAIERSLDLLSGDVSLGAASTIMSFDGTPDDAAQRLGESLGYNQDGLEHRHQLGHPDGFLE